MKVDRWKEEQIDGKQFSYQADFFQRISNLLEQEKIIFGNMVTIALENSTNLWKYEIRYTSITN